MWLINLLLLVALCAFIYAVYAQYNKTPAEMSMPMRVKTAIGAAITAILVWLLAFFQQGGIPS